MSESPVPAVLPGMSSCGGTVRPPHSRNAGPSEEPVTVREQQAQILFALGVMGYSPWGKRPYVFGETFATSCFDWAADEARRRGFKGRKQLIGAARRGRATTFAILKMQEACSFLTETEIAFHLARSASIVHFMETGRQMPGWTLKDPIDARASFRRTANV